MKKELQITGAMADGSRLRILMFLKSGELCVCQIIQALGLAPSTVSKHMSVLYNAGLVHKRKEGKWFYYRLARGKNTDKPVKAACRFLDHLLAENPLIQKDRKKIDELRKMDRNSCTRCYERKS